MTNANDTPDDAGANQSDNTDHADDAPDSSQDNEETAPPAEDGKVHYTVIGVM